ncbi:S8 family serine peptidase [Piscinibacter sp.]|uniref:S8 family serine peptidase n=1 Tax=Piscinibacter sp. TaxID=1903157 RepID=UPI002ED3818B
MGAAGGLIRPVWTPLGVGKQPVTVVLQMEGDPVALHQEAAGRKLQRHEKQQIKAQLRTSQSAVHGRVQGMGGKVLATYQSAYNGVKVRVTADKLQQLASLPGVVAVRPLWPVQRENVRGVPMIGTPEVWQSLGLHGEGVKVGIIDSGIDYTHANFGGPGTTDAYNTAHAAETAPANPALFGPAAPRVKGGIDLVGDSYNADPDSASYQPVPHPDPNPLDCSDNGHGSHVAGSAAGSGVTAGGTTYTGPYNGSTIASNSWAIGPGVAPKADLYAIRVFGCDGSTDVVVDAIEWAVDNDMDVINMSLGSSFGSKDSPDAVASTNAARSGVVVVTSAGNSGPNQYITGSPGTADGAIATAAVDPTPSFPGATLALSTGVTITAQNSNGAVFGNGTNYPIAVLRTSYPSGAVSLGCAQADYAAYPGGVAALAGKLIVTQRGVCSRVARAIFAQQNGAAASAMIDTTTGYPPFEGPITGSAETGPFNVTIPFFGVKGLAASATSDGGKLRLADGGTAVATNATIPNPTFRGFASFSSGGPRGGDSFLKPNISGPGVAIVSTAAGSGNGAATFSGTSMASPHVTGVAALTRQAHPTWLVEDIMSAIVNTGDPTQVTAYRTSRGGTGLVQPAKSTVTQVVAHEYGKRFGTAVNFGFRELGRDFYERKAIVLKNLGPTPVTFNVSAILPAGSPHSVELSHSVVYLPAFTGYESTEVVTVTVNVPAATAGASNGAGLSFNEVAGLIQFTPVSAADNGGATLRVPYYFVPRALSTVSTRIGKLAGTNPSTVATVTNRDGTIAGDADFYAWGLLGLQTPGKASNDVRAVGIQSFPADATGATQLMVFAVNTFNRWSNASTSEFDIYVDVDGDGTDDYIVVGVDRGALTTGSFDGRMGVFVFSTRSGGASQAPFLATAPTDSSTALLPLLSSQLCRPAEPCLSSTNPRITYHAVSFDLENGGVDVVAGTAKYNVWASAISQGGFATVAPGGTDKTNVIAVNSAEWALTPARGLMIVTLDNKSGPGEAQLIEVAP